LGPVPSLGPLVWADSKTVGGVTEVAVLAPIRKGRVPGERSTYEERVRTLIATLQQRVDQGIPTELDQVPTIHFGEIIVIRPEQYLVDSRVDGLCYEPAPDNGIPEPIDDYQTIPDRAQPSNPAQAGAAPRDQTGPPEFRSWLLTIVIFDGDLKAYFKEISVFTNLKFDQIFENCEDYPPGGTNDFEHFWNWIRRYQLNVDLFYPRYPELSVVRIKQLEAFKRRFDAFVTRVRTPTGGRVHPIDDLFDEFLRENEQYARNFPALGGVFEPGND
jgi:hypothetical protein